MQTLKPWGYFISKQTIKIIHNFGLYAYDLQYIGHFASSKTISNCYKKCRFTTDKAYNLKREISIDEEEDMDNYIFTISSNKG